MSYIILSYSVAGVVLCGLLGKLVVALYLIKRADACKTTPTPKKRTRTKP